mmetsp:Transcript_23995/g.42002  ORF Transcript_23995/g.42002 Transcript_23995/m.42002 type:complete len:93 (-) Transcript_23995:1250-1528(-)
MRLAFAAPISMCWPPNPGIGPAIPGRGPPMPEAIPGCAPDLDGVTAARDADLEAESIGGGIPPMGADLDWPPPMGIVAGIADAADLDTAAAI